MGTSIQIVFSATSSWFSRFICWVTSAEVDHARITFRDEALRCDFVVEANGRGFILVPWTAWRQRSSVVARYALSVPAKQQCTALRALVAFLDTEGDHLTWVRFIWRRLCLRASSPLDNPTQHLCAETVAKFLWAAGLTEFSYPETWTPDDLLQAARRMSAFQLVEGVE